MKKSYFVVGTDTEIGKTTISCGILSFFNDLGLRTLGLKPIASGSILNREQYENEDVINLMQASSIKIPYQQTNFISLIEPISPHLAARHQNVKIEVAELKNFVFNTLECNYDLALIEGAGGLFAPINDNATMADLIKALDFPVILVAGIRLGWINHSLLTIKALQQNNISIAGWVANQVDRNMLYPEENIETLKKLISAPLLAEIPFLADCNPPFVKNYLKKMEHFL